MALQWNVPRGKVLFFCKILINWSYQPGNNNYKHFTTPNQVHGLLISIVKIFPVFFVGNDQIRRCENNLENSSRTSNNIMDIESVI